jgi:flavin reductase (DIM6/NTAB) family NADH-FMN oxidoreductase RutF
MSSRMQSEPYTSLYPTPVVLVTSVDGDGKPNIVTLAWTGVLCSKPPKIGISVAPQRYSHDLIRKSGEFVVNVPTTDILKQVDYCGRTSGRKVEKFKEAKLIPEKAKKVQPPLIKECPINMECVVNNFVELGSHDLFVGEIVCVDVDESLSKTGKNYDFSYLKPIVFNPMTGEYFGIGGRLGRIGFSLK